MDAPRRHFLQVAAATTLGLGGLHRLMQQEAAADAAAPWAGYGPLQPDATGFLDLPAGFEARVVSTWGDRMDDGLLVPALADGMAAFEGTGDATGMTVLVRNHEVEAQSSVRQSAFGPGGRGLAAIDPTLLYDAGRRQPIGGGTTTIVYDHRRHALIRQFLSLGGTVRNCAGGPTPWGSWLTCEEATPRAGGTCVHDHGYVFEVPALPDSGLVRAVPLRAMGRFRHEAVAVDPRTGIVYQTEDRDDSCIYRFIPRTPGRLADGGRLQVLVCRDHGGLDTRNWSRLTVTPGERLPVRWVNISNVEAPRDDLRTRGWMTGGARFARGEGMWFGRGEVFFACTTGGERRLGQIWRYRPSPAEGTLGEEESPGVLELFIEPRRSSVARNADNLTVAPTGDLFVCEDGDGTDRILIVDPGGRVATFARNRLNADELAGICFSPDGSTAFVNIQGKGVTLAVSGPWTTGRHD